MNPADILDAGIRSLGLALPEGATDKLLSYLALLAKWNHTYNLTAVRNEADMVTHHLLDSLAILPHLGKAARLADVGSGAGLPGLVLAIGRPTLEVVSVEASQKKAAFQQQAKIELAIDNARICCGRVEDVAGAFEGAISRAFSDLADFVRLAGALAPRLYAMKGQYPTEEIERLPAGWRVIEAVRLAVPGLDAKRHLIVLGRT